MIKSIDTWLNAITMYRLMLYFLIALVGIALLESFSGILPFSPPALILSCTFFLAIGWVVNKIFARAFCAETNVESVYISALILTLIITPTTNVNSLPFFVWAIFGTMAGKFIFAYRQKHLFNPAALGVFVPSLFLNNSASWWVGSPAMFFPVLVGGLLIARKIERLEMVFMFMAVNVSTILLFTMQSALSPVALITRIFLESPLVFFAFVMLTEPLTSPAIRNLRLIYAVLTGFLAAPQFHLGSIFFTPESALLIANIFAFSSGFKERVRLKLIGRVQITPTVYDFIFQPEKVFSFRPGQYLEWTLPKNNSDSRGNRRFFTISSSPTEKTIRIGVKFAEKSSSFKSKLLSLIPNDIITATSLSGDFTLPKDPAKKLVFIAGGIGVTPFRSMLQFLADKNQKRNIILIYAAKSESEFAYQNLFNMVKEKIGIRTVYKVGRLEKADLTNNVPDYKDRIFYLSGPNTMVTGFESILKSLKIPSKQIKTDYFPGYA